MFKHEITEEQRTDIMLLLDWAEWAIAEHVQRGEVDMTEERERMIRVWDALACMSLNPKFVAHNLMVEAYGDVKAECDALFQKGQ